MVPNYDVAHNLLQANSNFANELANFLENLPASNTWSTQFPAVQRLYL